jgi:hypothetical protein
MQPTDDCINLPPEERRTEPAGIFAAGILRLRLRLAIPPDESDSEKSELGPERLELPAETVLSVHSG